MTVLAWLKHHVSISEQLLERMLLFRHGRARYTNGGRYEGDFKCEHRWGWGRHIYPGGDHYEGQWIDDKIQGERRPPCTDRHLSSRNTCPAPLTSAATALATALQSRLMFRFLRIAQQRQAQKPL